GCLVPVVRRVHAIDRRCQSIIGRIRSTLRRGSARIGQVRTRSPRQSPILPREVTIRLGPVTFPGCGIIGTAGDQGPKACCAVTRISSTIAPISERVALVGDLPQRPGVNVEVDALGIAQVCQSVALVRGLVTRVGRLVTLLGLPFKLPCTRIRRMVVVAAPLVHSGPLSREIYTVTAERHGRNTRRDTRDPDRRSRTWPPWQ